MPCSYVPQRGALNVEGAGRSRGSRSVGAAMTEYPAPAQRPLYYDSDERSAPLLGEARDLRDFSGLLRLLVVRDLTLRYKRSVLGVWWTLLNPLLTVSVMWLVFSAIFRFGTPDGEPYILYLTSGVLLITFFAQGVNTVGQSLVASSAVLSKVYVPPIVFAVAAATAAAGNFVLSLVPLVLLSVVTGWGVPWTLLLVPVPALLLLMLVTGIGLLVATAAIRFADTLDLVALGVLLIGYLTPTFYPVSIVPEEYRFLLPANPLYSYLTVFRAMSYGGGTGPGWCWGVMLATSLIALVVGAYAFNRRWRTLAAML